jgi:glycerate kinase
MRILIAPDKFKGTLSAAEAARAIARGVRKALPGAECTILPLSDGGEGFVSTMVKASAGRLFWEAAEDAIGRPKRARWGVLGDGKTAVIGLTEASALADVPLEYRNPGRTHNLGTGRILARVLQRGYRKVIVGLGGSATTEGGVSLAVPFGFRFLDSRGRTIPPHGEGLARLSRIEAPPLPSDLDIIVATDVANPLYGPDGAAYQFARQKGATPRQIEKLDASLRHLAAIVERDLGQAHHDRPGAGSAGGCGFGLMAFFRAKPQPGFAMIRDTLGLAKIVASHDLVITGEGTLDATSLKGKAPVGLGILAKQLSIPCLAIAGHLALAQKDLPFAGAFGIVTGSVSETDAKRFPARHVAARAAEAVRQFSR